MQTDPDQPKRGGVESEVSAPGDSIADPARRAEFEKLWESGVALEDVVTRRRAKKDARADAAN